MYAGRRARDGQGPPHWNEETGSSSVNPEAAPLAFLSGHRKRRGVVALLREERGTMTRQAKRKKTPEETQDNTKEPATA